MRLNLQGNYKNLSMEARMTICNMAIEAGAKYGLMQPDETTFNYVKGRPYATDFDSSMEWWKELYSDDDAYFEKVIELDVTNLEPQVTWGTNPEMGVSFSNPFPEIKMQMTNVLMTIWDFNQVKSRRYKIRLRF